MDRFQIIDDSAVVLRSRGVFRQVPVFRRGETLYAKQGSGFVQLRQGGGTSVPSMTWDGTDIGALRFKNDTFGALRVDDRGLAAFDRMLAARAAE